MKKFLAAVAAASLPALVGIAGEWYEPQDWDKNGLPEYSATIKFYWTDEYGEQHIAKEDVKVTEDGIMDMNGNPIEVSDIASGYLDEIRNLQSSLRSSDNEIRIANIADAVADLMTNSVHETWITNWTEAVEHITYEETFQIVNCITNVTQHEDFITNVFVHEEFVTNTFNHVNMITNWYDVFEVVTNYHEYFEFQTNVWNHENFITNVFVHEEFVTNTFNNVNWITNWYEVVNNVTNCHEFFEFQTNVYYHENFVTNVFNHENFITNTFENVNWITNWYEIVNSVTNYHEFFNFQTNLYQHEEFITNWVETFEAITNYHEFVTFETNMFEKLHYIENWTIVTNYIVRYLGGGTTGGGGEDPDPGPRIEPKDDPYSPEYEEDPVDKYILPVKNARIINAMTNRLFSAVDPGGALDFASLYTNDAARAEISGFYLAETNQLPIKAEIAPGIYGVDWVDYPEELIKMTSGNIKQIFRWWQQHSGVTNLLANIITNHEALAEMKTNLWSRVKVETLLDNQSVWTNGARQIEVKGYETSPLYTVPFANLVKTPDDELVRRMTWEPLPIADDEAASRFSAWVDSTIESTTNAVTISEEDPVPAKILSLHGFESAEDGQVPYKYIVDPEEVDPAPVTTHIGNRLQWKYAFDRALKFKGTDGSSYTVGPACSATNTVTFASASDSNVRVHVAEDQDDPGSVRITIGVYYLTESALTPPVVE